MKKKIWIWNHYATDTFRNQGGRHYWFAENLNKEGYKAAIFCASTVHNSNESIDTKGQRFITDQVNGIPYVFVRTPEYSGNGKKRVINMYSFYKNLFYVAKEYVKVHGRPDVILASSVHPFTLVAGIKIAKKMGIPCICEVRDLWPESIVEFSNLKRDSLVAKMLYAGERWIYKKADRLIFTMEGGKDYIIDKGWDNNNGGPIDIGKVRHINNGIDLNAFDLNIGTYMLDDEDLNNEKTFKVIYAGSIRKANNIELIINAAKYIKEKSNCNIKFLIYGDGNERANLEKKCKKELITNVVFKGKVEKKYIPYIVSKANLNILNYSYHNIWKYGGSQNKNFEYLASGRPILSTIKMGYDIISKYGAGISLSEQSDKSIGDAIISIANMNKEEYLDMSNRARKAAQDYDFKVLTKKLIDIVEEF